VSWGDLGKKPKLRRDSKLDFGKHAGETVDGLIDSDPQYLEWCCDEITGFSERLDDGIEDDIRDAAEEARTQRQWNGEG
jgi:hypothetical protein